MIIYVLIVSCSMKTQAAAVQRLTNNYLCCTTVGIRSNLHENFGIVKILWRKIYKNNYNFDPW